MRLLGVDRTKRATAFFQNAGALFFLPSVRIDLLNVRAFQWRCVRVYRAVFVTFNEMLL
jgi:hypothetical protein